VVKKLLILGDSFCHGVGTVSPFNDPRNTEYAFGRHLADYYGLEYVNLAEPGISIQRTVEKGYSYLIEHKQQVEKVIIGWTTPGRVGFYSQDAMLQILPSYILLGNNHDTDLFVDYKNNVKFITNKNNQSYLHVLPQLHKIMIENNFINQDTTSAMLIDFFRLWLNSQQIAYSDFAVFGNKFNTQLSASFNNIMETVTRHPSIEEQKKFANLLIQQL
jgi:hypothetical protein